MNEQATSAELDILGIGCATLDTVGTVDEFPRDDGKTRVFDLEEHGGGPAATAMVACRRLGLRAGLIAKVGDDEAGKKIRTGLAEEGVDVSRLVAAPGERSMVSFCFANRRTGQRIVYYYRSQRRSLEIEQIDRRWLTTVPILLVDGVELPAAGRAADIVRGAGGLTVMDAGTAHPSYADALPHIDYLVASWKFARDYTEKETPEAAIETLRWSGFHRAVVVTLGDQGYIAAEGGRPAFRGDAFRVKALDTTGAGDTFHGAFCVGLRRDWPLEQVCVFASACAALKCARLGGRAGIPTRNQAIAFLKQHARRYNWPAPNQSLECGL